MHLKPSSVTIIAKPKPRKFGLGDAVAIVAQPVAKAIDKIAGSDLQNCLGCEERKARLNAILPDVTDPFKRE